MIGLDDMDQSKNTITRAQSGFHGTVTHITSQLYQEEAYSVIILEDIRNNMATIDCSHGAATIVTVVEMNESMREGFDKLMCLLSVRRLSPLNKTHRLDFFFFFFLPSISKTLVLQVAESDSHRNIAALSESQVQNIQME